MGALEQFEAAEANLAKLERLWTELHQLIPENICFGSNPEYEDRARAYADLLEALPAIDGWKPEREPPDLDDVAQSRFDAMEIDEITAHTAVDRWLEEPGRELREYRYRLNTKRRALIRNALIELIDAVDADLRLLRTVADALQPHEKITEENWTSLKAHIKQINVLLGSSVQHPARWGDLSRHIHFGRVGDLNDIVRMDWPDAKEHLRKGLYGANEPVPVKVQDLSDVVAANPTGPISTALAWSNLDDERFERLLFDLIGGESGYENLEWLMQTRAADRGRDLSVTRVITDPLMGVQRQRVIIQCKHWLSRSVSVTDVSVVRDQMRLWPNPPVHSLIIATSGRFTADAVQLIESNNADARTPLILMWPESHLERLLAARPALIAEYQLRPS